MQSSLPPPSPFVKEQIGEGPELVFRGWSGFSGLEGLPGGGAGEASAPGSAGSILSGHSVPGVAFAVFFFCKHFETTAHNVGKGGLELLSSWRSNPDVLGLLGVASMPGSGLSSFVSSPLQNPLENFLIFFSRRKKINLTAYV
jgi:hypothetical protein